MCWIQGRQKTNELPITYACLSVSKSAWFSVMDSPNLTCFRYSNIFHQLMKLSGIHLFCFGFFVIWFYFSPEKNLMPYYCWMHLRTIKTNKWKTVNRLLFRPCFRSTGQILHLGLYTQRLELQLKNYSFVPLQFCCFSNKQLHNRAHTTLSHDLVRCIQWRPSLQM